MGTYAELKDLESDDGLRNRVEVAVVIAATAILEESTPTSERARWAVTAVGAPGPMGQRMLRLVLARNKAETPAVIQTASDSMLQAHVDAVGDNFITGSAA